MFDFREINWDSMCEASLVNCENAYCKNKAIKICTGCKMKRYCSSNCQKEDWEYHKEHCNKKKYKVELMNRTVDPYPINTKIILRGNEDGLFKKPVIAKISSFDPIGKYLSSWDFCEEGYQAYGIKCLNSTDRYYVHAEDVHLHWELYNE